MDLHTDHEGKNIKTMTYRSDTTYPTCDSPSLTVVFGVWRHEAVHTLVFVELIALFELLIANFANIRHRCPYTILLSFIRGEYLKPTVIYAAAIESFKYDCS